jgi:hypothetical protein
VSCSSFRHVVALLHDGEADAWAVLERAVELADTERARLTLAKTTDPGWLFRWFSPLTPLCRMAPLPEVDLTTVAGRRLARWAEIVPVSIPVCTVLLPTDTAAALGRLAARTPYDLLVVAASPLARSLKLRRQLRRLEVSTLAVAYDGFPWTGSSPREASETASDLAAIEPELLVPPGLT